MTDKEALEAFSRGKKLSQAVVERLWSKGYIEGFEIAFCQDQFSEQ
jgi:hypothetical protein